MTTTNMPTPDGARREISVFVVPVIGRMSVPGSPQVVNRAGLDPTRNARRTRRRVLVIVVVDQPRMAEAAHRIDDRQHRGALRRQLVLDPRRRLRIAAARDDPLLLEHVEALGERARADPVARVLELGEAARPLGEVVHDHERGPLGADEIGGCGDGADSCRRGPPSSGARPSADASVTPAIPPETMLGLRVCGCNSYPFPAPCRAPTTNDAAATTVARAIAAKPAR